MKKILLPFLASFFLCSAFTSCVSAAPTDIVPRGSVVLDAFATLARTGALTASDTPEDFLGEPMYTRQQLAGILEHLIQDADKLAQVQTNSDANAALQTALAELQPELKADGVDFSDVPTATTKSASISGYVQPELRLRAGGDRQPGTGAVGIYRITALGNVRSNIRYALSASNWPSDERRNFNNDRGPHDFTALNEAYISLDAGRGLTFDLGRKYDRWGPGYRGATMLSDNSPAFDQLQVAFPFSLGSRFGREYHFTQMGTTFTEGGERKYFEARRIEYAFSPRLQFDFQEAFKSSSSKSLEVTLFPDFYNAQSAKFGIKGLQVNGLDQTYNSFFNFGLSYNANPDTRVYGQIGVDDIQTPGRKTYRTPRKIAYLVGTTFSPATGTSLTAEYTFADPTTYSSRIVETQWQHGMFDEIALPNGPNSREIFLRLSQRVAPALTISVQGRDRRRHNDSFPAPNSRDLSATAQYSLNPQNGIALTYHDYRQDAFPLAPSVPVAGDGFTPDANIEGYYGQTLRIKQLDVSYQFFF